MAGKFDQYRRDLEFDAVNQAFRALGRLLLAEPEDELAQVRERILAAVGPNAGLLTAVVPEFAALLAVPPDAGDPLTAQARAQRAAAAVLRAVASRKRPVVVFLDDLQWAGRTPLGFVDLVLSEEPVDGLLLVGAYREGDVDAAHPLAAPLSRWRDQAGVRHLRLGNLPVPSLAAMVAEMLHVDPAAAAGLAEVIEPHTRGNPYETVELLNALRRDGVLTATAAGWRWDEAAVRAHLGQSEVAGLLAARVAAMPAPSRQMVEAMACLGGRAELSLLQAATGEPAERGGPGAGARPRRGPAGGGARGASGGAVPPRPDPRGGPGRAGPAAAARPAAGHGAAAGRRCRSCSRSRPSSTCRWSTRSTMPRSGAQVVGLLRRAAGQATLIGDYALVNALLAAALRLVDPGETATLVEVHTGRHAALYGLGRLEEADEEYRTIEGLCPTALDRADATAVQVRSLTHRNRFAEAIGLGLESLRELGITVPAADRLPAELDHQFGYLYRWLDHTDAADDLARPDITDPALLAASRLINAVLPAAYFAADHATVAWLSLEALRIWLEHGPGPYPGRPGQPRRLRRCGAARRLRRRVPGGAADPGAGRGPRLRARHLAGALPVRCPELLVRADRKQCPGRSAGPGGADRGGRPGLRRLHLLRDRVSACWTARHRWTSTSPRWRRGWPSCGGPATSRPARCSTATGGWLACCAAKAPPRPVRRSPPTGTPATRWRFSTRISPARSPPPSSAIRPAWRGTPRRRCRCCRLSRASTRPPWPACCAGWPWPGRPAPRTADERGGLLAELDEVTRWLAARAADAPDNFLHLLRLVEAERAWAVGDFRAAALAFDAARREAAQRQRPWHRALIAEHAARFYLAHGLEHAGYDLLAQARQEYLAWGATAKVGQLDWAYPALRPPADATAGDGAGQPGDLPHRRSAVTTGTIDLLGIVSASQALSSETSIDRLHARVVEVLSAMTGATGVHLLLWSEDRQDWLLPAPGGGGTVPVSGTGHERAVPMSVLRYVQRTREPLVVDDATGDDRFARDPYFADVDCCSLLAVPDPQPRHAAGGAAAGEPPHPRRVHHRAARRGQAHRRPARRLPRQRPAVRRVPPDRRRAGGACGGWRRWWPAAAPPQQVFAAVAEEVGAAAGGRRRDSGPVRPGRTRSTVVGAWTSTGAPAPTPVGGRLAARRAERHHARVADRPARPDRRRRRHLGQRSATSPSRLGTPLRRSARRSSVEGRLWGAIGVALTGGESLPADTETRLAGFTELVATAIANAESAGRAHRLPGADRRRRRPGPPADRAGPARRRPAAAGLAGAAAARGAGGGAARARRARATRRAVAEATGALDELREIARGIHPAILAEGGLGPALQSARPPLPGPRRPRGARRRSGCRSQVEVSAYYVVAEALTNAAKHARASAVTRHRRGRHRGDVLRVAVRDDGAGGADFTRGTGLVGLKDRVEALGGRIFLDSPPGAGTSLRAELPLTAANGGVTPPARTDITGATNETSKHRFEQPHIGFDIAEELKNLGGTYGEKYQQFASQMDMDGVHG